MKGAAARELVGAIEAGGVLDSLRAAAELRRVPAGEEVGPLLRLAENGDALARVTAAYALARRPGVAVNRALLTLLDADDMNLREAASLAFAERRCWPPAIPALCRETAAGGFAGMLAQLVLDEWFRQAPRLVGRFVRHALASAGGDPAARSRLAEIVQDRDHRASDRPPRVGAASSEGLRIAQVVLQGRIDAGLQEVGAGDGGGLATLVVHLSRALGRRAEVGHAVTITRAFADEHAGASHEFPHEPIDDDASIARVAFGPNRYLATAEMWPYRLAAERALERTLRRLLPLDVVHLRFADVGTFAAARACRRLGIPVCFTLAADPHVVIRGAEQAGTLSRETFAETNRREHLLLRAHLVDSMLEQAEGLVAFPRQEPEADLDELLGVDASVAAARGLRTVSEGVSLRTLDRGRAGRDAGPEPAVWGDLRAAVAALPPERAGLPLVLSVGRFHRVKGFPRLVEAWAGDPDLFGAFNLAIVGGNLEHPTAEEQGVIQALREVELRTPEVGDGLLLLGHRSHDDVAHLLHAARSGVRGAVAAGGVYACASDKEEFGLALLEALAVGLPVVAPRIGGPATYVDHGSTGMLVDTTSVGELRRGLHEAAGLRDDEARAARAEALVRSRFSIDAMAAQLTSLYLDLAGADRLERAA
ncbi:MAG TPA: glycosyltransferase [Gaiellaceae bacterium]|nr:glycosyltransferase [Gaiellaceae bacterium]